MADKSKNTGTGGINIDGKVYTPDVGVPDAAGGAQGDYSSGDINVDKTTKDISKPTRETFAKYLSKTTLGTAGSSPHKNVYPVGAGDQTKVEEIRLKDTQGNPVSPGAQNNETKFAAGFNQTISSNNPAGIKRGLTTGTGQDGNTLLPSASTAADPGGNYVKFVTSTSDGKGLQEPIKTYTKDAVDPNLYDYDSNKVSISDGTLNQSPSGLREDIRIISTNSNVETDGGTSKNILGADNGQGDYTLTATEARALAGTTTAKNRFPIDITPSVVTLRDASGNPVSVTASQNSVTNTSFFTKLVEEKKEGDKTVQVISVRELSSYTPALTSAASVNANKFEIKRGKTVGGTIDGNELLLTIAPETDGVATLTPAAKTYTDEVIKPNLNNYSTTEVVIPEYEISGIPTGIKDLNKTGTFAEDGGTSENILGGKKTLTLIDAANTLNTKTANNFYPLDLTPTELQPDKTQKLKVTSVSSVDKLAKTNNTKYFADIAIGSNPTVNSKGKLKNQGDKDPYKNKDLPDGNTLLSNATIAAIPGGKYVKPAKELNDPIKSYTTEVVATNLYDFGSQNIDIDNVKTLDFFGPKLLYKPKSGPEDAGTFDNIKSNPVGRVLSKLQTQNYFQDEIIGKNQVPGQIKNELTPYYGLNALPSDFSINDANGFPASPSDAQTAGKFIGGNYPELTEYVYGSDIPTSYSENITSLDIKRGKSEASGPSGHKLLKDAAKPNFAGPYIKPAGEVNPIIGKYVSTVLEKNRYNPLTNPQPADAEKRDVENLFVPSYTPGAESPNSIGGGSAASGGQRFENISDDVSSADRGISFVERTKLYAPSQLKFGESPQSMNNRGAPVTGFTFRRLTRIGTILQLRAAGEIISITGDQNDDPRSNLEQLAAALVPGLGQAGAGVPLSRELLNVTEIIKNLPDESTGAAGVNTIAQYEGELIDINRNFEGVVNTTLEKFSGFSSLGLLILAIVLVAVVILVFWGLAALLGNSDSLNRVKKLTAGKSFSNSQQISGLGTFMGRAVGGGTNIVADIVQATYDGSAATALFGIKPTFNRDYSDAVYRGALAFFGLGSGNAASGSPNPPPLLSYPGQVVVTSRAIVRGVAQLTTAFIDLGSAFASGNIFEGIFKLIDIIEVIRNSRVIKALNTFSQLGDRKPYTVTSDVEYIKVQSQTEKALEQVPNAPVSGPNNIFGSEEMYQVPDIKRLNAGVKISEIDSIDNKNVKHQIWQSRKVTSAPGATKNERFFSGQYVGVSQVKNRLQDSRALAWSSYRSPSFLINASSIRGGAIDGQPDYSHMRNTSNNTQQVYAAGPRLDQRIVADYETAIDGEYMPFYFHDLRTNEIIGFHAFLTSLSDDYSANYESITGVGRAEPVRIYKDTQRKIGISFMVAALDKEDFDYMWEKINRLTMLVYPQYTRGKTYADENGVKFEKPFTQMVAAGPMVRLRLGNLLRSNYSKFNLARIFGLDDPSSNVFVTQEQRTKKADEIKQAREAAQKAQATKDAEQEFETNLQNLYKKDYTYSPKIAAVYKTKLDADTAKRLDINNQNVIAPPKPPKSTSLPNSKRWVENGEWYRTFDGDANGFLRFKIDQVLPAGSNRSPEYAYGTFEAASGATAEEKKQLEPNPTSTKYWVPISDLKLAGESLGKYATEKIAFVNGKVSGSNNTSAAATPNAPTTAITSIKDFMNANNNVIVRSFESTGGKGLAGFIDSIAFDWYDRTTWDIDADRKAPKMCKVTISFTPVHDIAPGLTANGENRAPIYPLGPYAFGTRGLKNES